MFLQMSLNKSSITITSPLHVRLRFCNVGAKIFEFQNLTDWNADLQRLGSLKTFRDSVF